MKKAISEVCCVIYLLSHPCPARTLFHQPQRKHTNNNWKVFRACLFAYSLCSPFSPNEFRLFCSQFATVACVSLADRKIYRSPTFKPLKRVWQLTRSGFCGVDGAMYGLKHGTALRQLGLFQVKSLLTLVTQEEHLSYAVRKGICSIKKPIQSLRLMLELGALVSPATPVVILRQRRDAHACLSVAPCVQSEGPKMLISCPSGSNKAYCPAAGRDVGGQSHLSATRYLIKGILWLLMQTEKGGWRKN